MKTELNIQELEIGRMTTLYDGELALAKFVSETMDNFSGNGEHLAGIQILAGARMLGICGEIAYCKMANVYPMTFDLNSMGKFDLIHSGYKVDIKTTEGDNLYVNEKQGNGAQIYVMMQRRENSFKFMGRISSKRLMEYPLEELVNKSKARVVPAGDLQ